MEDYFGGGGVQQNDVVFVVNGVVVQQQIDGDIDMIEQISQWGNDWYMGQYGDGVL